MIETTTKIRDITNDEKTILLSELLNVDETYWSVHLPAILTSLREGRSIHINFIDYDLTVVQKMNNSILFPKTLDIIKSISNLPIGRVYWHRLLPGQKIDTHNDSGVVDRFKGKLLFRYQIYLDVPEEMELIIDGKMVKDPKVFSNSLYHFALQRNHYYKNNSNNPFYLLVFDFMETG